MLLGRGFKVPVVTAGRAGLVATEVRAVLLAVGLGAALITSKIHNEVPLINSYERSKGSSKLSVDLIIFLLTFCYGDSNFAARQRIFGPYGPCRARWFRSNRTRRGALCGGTGGRFSG